MTDKIRWGILGTGNIAHRLATAICSLPGADLTAIGSRSAETAKAFGNEYAVPRRFHRYEDLVACSDVDVVYIATPHVFHARDAELALRAGKPVLCEKPLTVNAREAAALIKVARSERLFLMEAMWTRLVPAIVRLRDWIDAGAIGKIRLFSASTGMHQPFDPENRLFNPALAGGALLDVGVYAVSLASMLLGRPSAVSGVVHRAPTGVDEQCAVSLAHPGGALATFVATLSCDAPRDALVVGTEGWIRIHSPITHPEALTRGTLNGDEETMRLPHLGSGYAHEVMEVMECLRGGQLESGAMPLDESLSIMKTVDAIREQWGMTYPGE